MNQNDFIDAINIAHLENSKRSFFYFRDDKRNSVSPVTNFIFEFFIYNSLYSVDWQASTDQGIVAHHNSSTEYGDEDWLSEGQQQVRLEKFLKKKCCDRPELLNSAFAPLVHLKLQGDWTKVTPDDRVSLEDGERFFRKMSEIAELAQGAKLLPTKKHFDLIGYCRRFCYLVRNNIFHGSKSLGQLWDKEQQRRIEVYDLFLRSLNSLFFTAMDREGASGKCQSDLIGRIASGDRSIQPRELRDHFTNSTGLVRGAGLIRQLPSEDQFSALDENETTALFYPSAGFDFLLPLIVGMARCTDFYFYDVHQYCPREKRAGSRSYRTAIESVLSSFDKDFTCETNKNVTVYYFNVDGILRKVWLVHDDNLVFLKRDVVLTCYFHRGDSWGEGGSGQEWDSDLLPQLIEKASPTRGCLVLTDGQPGDLKESTKLQMTALDRPKSKNDIPYYVGILRKED